MKLKLAVADLELEVLAHPVATQCGAGREADLGGSGERAARTAIGDLGEAVLGLVEQLFAFAGTLGTDERVSADDEPLAGILVGRVDLGQVGLVKERQLQRAGGGQPLDLRRLQRADPAAAVGLAQALDVGLRDHPAIAHDDHRLQAEALLQLGDLGRQRLSSCSSPEKTSTATGRPGRSHSRP